MSSEPRLVRARSALTTGVGHPLRTPIRGSCTCTIMGYMAAWQRSNPWEGSLENLTSRVGKPVKKAVSDAAKTVATDIKQQVTGDYGKMTGEQMGVAEIDREKREEIEKQKKENLAAAARRLEEINREIERVRKEREKKQTEQARQAQQVKQAKKFEEKKKKEKPVWKKLLKNVQGSGERKVHAGG